MLDIRRLTIDDMASLRNLRLTALQEHPEAFGSSYAIERQWPDEIWRSWLERNPPFGAFRDCALVGLASCNPSSAAHLAHRATLGAMYVVPSERGRTAARQLVEALVAYARSLNVEQLHLSVTAANARAVRFYEGTGFVRYGTEPAGLKVGNGYWDVLLMVRFLSPGA